MPFPFMTLRPLLSLVALTFLAAPVLLTAQTSSSEEERLEKLMADSAQWYVPKTTVSIGFRMLNSGGKVAFGNLGAVAFTNDVAPYTDGFVERVYDNGIVSVDAPRSNEKDVDGNVTTTPGSRYAIFSTVTQNVLDSDGNPVLNPDGTNVTEDVQKQTGDYLSYTPGLTRSWGYGAESQVTDDGRIAMSSYSATSEGGSAMKKTGASAGVEFQYVRAFSKGTPRLQWGMLAGITLNGINGKTSGEVTSTLNIRTDYYSLNGQEAPPLPVSDVTDSDGNVTGTTTSAYSAPSTEDYTDADGNVITADGKETTVPISGVPDGPTEESSVAHGVIVKGNWQVRGAYFMVRVGPRVRLQLSERFGLNASLGVAGAYAGTVYSVAETFEVPDLPDVLVGSSVGTETSSEAKFLSGYYADLNLEWFATERTGLFGGFTAQKFDGYDQFVGSRTARIDLGSSVGLRGGVSIKF